VKVHFRLGLEGNPNAMNADKALVFQSAFICVHLRPAIFSQFLTERHKRPALSFLEAFCLAES